MNDYEIKRQLLLKYISMYLSKNLRMKMVLVRIVDQLKNNRRITPNQFNSLIKFLEREPKFISLDRTQITTYFSPIIYKQKETDYGSNTLCEFFV